MFCLCIGCHWASRSDKDSEQVRTGLPIFISSLFYVIYVPFDYCLTLFHLDATVNIHIWTLYSMKKFFLMLERRPETSVGLPATLCVTSPRNLLPLGRDNGFFSSPNLTHWLRGSRSFLFNGYGVGGGGGAFPGSKAAFELTTHYHRTQKLRVLGAILPFLHTLSCDAG